MNSRTEDVAQHQNTTTERIDLPSFINQKASFTSANGVNYLRFCSPISGYWAKKR